MFDEPTEQPNEKRLDPLARARDKADESRMHAELAAVFEGPRKFDAALRPDLDPDTARNAQRTMARLDKARAADGPILPPDVASDAASLLNLPDTAGLSTNDYHLYRRPGEVMIVRCLQGDEVETFYERLQAHFDAAMEGHRDDERSAHEWQQDPKVLKYLEALDALDVKLAERYRRDLVKQGNAFALSTVTADELNIAYLADMIMGVPVTDLVGDASVPPDDPTEQDLAWFFKLFLLRGARGGVEQACFFAYLQKSDDTGW